MRFTKSSLVVAALAAGLVATSASADTATRGQCMKLATEVNHALAANASSASINQAQFEKSRGAYYCNMDSYEKGVEHYTQALTLLGAK